MDENTAQAWKQAGDAMAAAVAKIAAAAIATAEAIAAALAAATVTLQSYSDGGYLERMLAEVTAYNAAYNAAAAERPDWVHRANHAKKKRIRKKYHDRIMREYGGLDK